ncbi:hypothetical protein FALBO_135 [Fusarium albosuccineum]|uniref:Uncharacterized protein n=1 Tax=Fusarium albosuccineum TaxID=1237068 RepID=A0A8H4LQR7_9HYPO|nr:hypothetical protein FALBO_135 [Fusarium albosuccineum]
MANALPALEALQGKPRRRRPNIQAIAASRVNESDFKKGVIPSAWRGRDEIVTKPNEAGHPGYRFRVCFRLWICSRRALDRHGLPLYVELALPDDEGENPADFLRHFLSQIRSPDAVVRAFLQTIDDCTIQPVYISADFSHPRSWFVKQLMAWPERQKALIAAFTGLRNPLVCRACARSLETNVSWNKEHILFPFTAYISSKDLMGGKCVNCIWHSHECGWEYLAGYQAKSATEGLLSFPLQGGGCHRRPPPTVGIDQLDPYSYPGITHDFPAQPWSSKRDREVLGVGKKVAAEDTEGEF